jgi:NAD(P) transhydrogenase
MVPEYDLVVIGSGPAGQKCAIAAAKARKRVAVIDRTVMMGGDDFAGKVFGDDLR